MKLIFWFVFFLLLSGGIGAYIGDRFGRRIGKKKISVFTLRPKTTSTVLTILMSMAISLGIFGTFILVSEDARMALLYPEIKQERALQQYQEHLQMVTASLQRMQNQTQMPVFTASNSLDFPTKEVQQPSHSPTHFRQVRKFHPPTAAKIPPANGQKRLESYQQLLLANSFEKSKRPQLLAHKGDIIFSFEIETGNSPQMVLSEILKASSQYAKTLGVTGQNNEYIQVLPENIEQTITSLKANQKASLQVSVANDTPEHKPLPVELKIEPPSTPPISPHEVLEAERLKGNGIHTALKQDLNQAILKIVKERQDSGKEKVDYVPTDPNKKVKFISPQTYTQTASTVKIDNIHSQNATIYGTIKAEKLKQETRVAPSESAE